MKNNRSLCDIERRYKKLIKKIRNGKAVKQKKIKMIVNDYLSHKKPSKCDFVNIFPAFEKSFTDNTNEEDTYIFYTECLKYLLTDTDVSACIVVLKMYNLLLSAQVSNNQILLQFLINQKIYGYIQEEINVLYKIDNVNQMITDSYSLDPAALIRGPYSL